MALAAVLLLPLAACNTMEGLGRDTKAAGDALTGAAKDNKGY
ncbi:MAG TPA: entericidin A/B family lipoprotein [Alphaproteobacteria bacterium]|nr:entericidin A/B family lipoprotein [Alphaproteobacteria bacterium]